MNIQYRIYDVEVMMQLYTRLCVGYVLLIIFFCWLLVAGYLFCWSAVAIYLWLVMDC